MNQGATFVGLIEFVVGVLATVRSFDYAFSVVDFLANVGRFVQSIKSKST